MPSPTSYDAFEVFTPDWERVAEVIDDDPLERPTRLALEIATDADSGRLVFCEMDPVSGAVLHVGVR